MRLRDSIILFFFVFVLFSATLSYGEMESYRYHLKMGRMNFEMEEYEAAEKEFESALEEEPEGREAIAYYGAVLNRRGAEGAERYLKKALYMDPENQLANLELGIYYFDRKLYQEAGEFFEIAIDTDPRSKFAQTAERYLTAIRSEGKKKYKKWNLGLSIGTQYDSNVILTPEDGPIPGGIAKQSDWRGTGSVTASYIFFEALDIETALNYSFYRNLHTQLKEFNVSSHTFKLDSLYSFGKGLSLDLSYSLDYTTVGGDKYSINHAISPLLLIELKKNYFTVVEYRYKLYYYEDTDFFVSNSSRTGSNHLIGFIQLIPAGVIKCRVGYYRDSFAAKEEFWNYVGNKGFISATADFPLEFSATLSAEYYARNYEGENPLSGGRRKDRIQTYSAAIRKEFLGRLDLIASQQYILNESNIPEMDYRRSVTGINFAWKF